MALRDTLLTLQKAQKLGKSIGYVADFRDGMTYLELRTRMGVKDAVERMKYRHKLLNIEPWQKGEGEHYHKGLRVEVEIREDTDGDFSHIGKWVQGGNHSIGEVMKNPSIRGSDGSSGWGRSVYGWFELYQSVHERFTDYKALKIGKRDAYERAWADAKQDFDQIKEGRYECWGVIVKLYAPHDDEPIAEDSLWGIDDEDFAVGECVFDVLQRAYEQAVSAGWREPKSILGQRERKLRV